MSSQLLTQLKEGSLKDSGILEHLAQLIRGSVQNKTELKGLSNIELFSYYLRSNKFSFQKLLDEAQLANSLAEPKQYSHYVSAVQALKAKLASIDDHRPHLRPDLKQEQIALRTAGAGVGEKAAHHLTHVIKTLAIEHQTTSIRFWGKILGYQDYWVVQGRSSKQYLSELPANAEAYGTGVNSYSYWVATDLLGQWTELPLVTPAQVAASRKFKYVFSGDLERAVNHHSSFHGQEKHLLKCVVARISHSCELVPKGLYKVGEENPNAIEFEEEFKTPEVADMNSLDSWVHLNPHIQLQGRCSTYIDPSLSEEQKEALTAELAEKDPAVERLKGVADDKPFEGIGFAANWTNSIAGESVPVSQVGKLEGQNLVYGVAVLRNTVWPGAVTVGYRGGWVNFYAGYGHRLSQPYDAIKELGEVQQEAGEVEERPEPNPAVAPAPEGKKQGEGEGEPAPEAAE